MTTDTQLRPVKLRPEFFLPEGANIPPEWIVEDNAAEQKIVVPSWGTGDKMSYRVLMLKEDRSLHCECLGFRHHGKCHHLPYLIGFSTKPVRARGVQDTTLEAFMSIQVDLSDRQRTVLDTLRTCGPMTNQQLAQVLNWPINCVTPRVLELRRLEPPLVEDAGRVLEEATGRHAHVWRATGALI